MVDVLQGDIGKVRNPGWGCCVISEIVDWSFLNWQ